MSAKQITSEEMSAGINGILQDFDEHSGRQLEFYKEILTVKQLQLQQEKAFREAKWGKQDQRVLDIENRLLRDGEVLKGLDIAINKSRLQTSPFTGNGWRIHGFVYDEKEEPKAGKKIVIIDAEKKEAVRNIKPVLSDENGYYSLTLTPEQLKSLKEAKWALAIVIGRQEMLVVRNDIVPGAGMLLYQDIRIKG